MPMGPDNPHGPEHSRPPEPRDLDATVDWPGFAPPPAEGTELFENPSAPGPGAVGSDSSPATDLPRPGPAGAVRAHPTHPERIGPFTIRGVLGQGGMGVVYRAEQASPRREVALKVIRPGYATPDILRRFTHEAHVLGKLQHPCIAQVYQAGAADTGAGPQPFFAMELVHGPTLSEHLERARPDVRQRVRLMVQVCDAVQHAHAKGVIHRDLKPANILIVRTRDDAPARPKILDFGVARVTDADVQSATLATTAGQLVGTIPYMSPEQVAADPDALDTRSDVYALGVILYETLCGELPYELRGRGIAEAARIIREVEPMRLGSHDRTLRGDLETITAKALEKDPERRYQSAAELGADLERYLDDQPIQARPPSSVYQLRKFARRNRPVVAGASAAAVMLALGVVGTAWQAVRASREAELARAAETRAETEADAARAAEARATRALARAEAINEFLVRDLLGAANPAVAQGREIAVGALLDQASQRVGEALADQPDLEMSVRGVMGEVFMNLADAPAARREMDRVLELTTRELGPNHPETLGAERTIAELEAQIGELAAAQQRLDALIPRVRALLGPEHRETLLAEAGLARVLMERGQPAEAERILRDIVQRLSDSLGPDAVETLNARNNLATALKDLQRLEECAQINRDLLERRTRLFGERHPDTLVSMNNLATALQLLNRPDEAEDLLRRTLEGRRAVFGDTHPATLTALINLGDSAIRRGDFAAAEPLLLEAIAGYESVYGLDHPSALVAQNNLAYLYEDTGRRELAEPLYRQVLEARLRVIGPSHPDTLAGMNNLAMLLQATGRAEEALPLFERCTRTAQQSLGDAHPFTAIFQNNFGEALCEVARYADALAELEPSGAVIESVFGPEHVRTERARARLERARAGLAGGP